MIIITTAYYSYDVYKPSRIEFASRCETMQRCPPTLDCIFHQQLKWHALAL